MHCLSYLNVCFPTCHCSCHFMSCRVRFKHRLLYTESRSTRHARVGKKRVSNTLSLPVIQQSVALHKRHGCGMMHYARGVMSLMTPATRRGMYSD